MEVASGLPLSPPLSPLHSLAAHYEGVPVQKREASYGDEVTFSNPYDKEESSAVVQYTEKHHLEKRFAWPGANATATFNALWAPAGLFRFTSIAFTLAAFRTLGIYLGGE